MHLYLPIAGLSVNAAMIVLLGGMVGILSGMFGVGGGFLITPFLIFYGVPPAVAVASSATQITGASVSGVLAHSRRKGVDFRMGWVLVAGGATGSLAGGFIFRLLQKGGQIDLVVGLLYVALLGWIGLTMARESVRSVLAIRAGKPVSTTTRRHHRLIAVLPMRWRFYGAGLYISPLAPFLLGLVSGMLTVLMGVSGGFILVPAMIYIFGVSTRVVVGTSLFQGLFVTAATTLVHALTTHAVDLVLAALLLVGSVTGAQIGARLVQTVKPEYARMALAVIVLFVAFRMAIGLTWQPDAIYTVQPL
ncbi:sulfite exporter TauE/SafE family protein [Sphingomonas nostoxanthinifaciens]|uniref:sulfite exporter TauE/SafE family protein n=1 Tax=Sphingomonas nostoxanthinifaciens TaxID=2872652 RepID=UPI001CC1C97C|nr:sulfite exporter TauE/SafE family protein [Sphingomonas nostoxanthinifaciens]UAK24586.1 sulfite exporter TauE/SafE family protein [Sphingomonas nostoxanthinifaciens]